MKFTHVALAVILWVGMAHSQDDPGTVAVWVDGVESPWEMAELRGAAKSNWRGDSATAHINLQAVSVPELAATPQSQLSLGFYLTGVGDANFVNEVDVVLSLPTQTGAYLTLGHGAGSIINLKTATHSEGTIALTGSFSVELLFSDDFGVTLDASRVRTVRGNFNVALAPE
jgi:hypothetical protein